MLFHIKQSAGDGESLRAGAGSIRLHINQSYLNEFRRASILFFRHPLRTRPTRPFDRAFGITDSLRTERVVISLVMIPHDNMNAHLHAKGNEPIRAVIRIGNNNIACSKRRTQLTQDCRFTSTVADDVILQKRFRAWARVAVAPLRQIKGAVPASCYTLFFFSFVLMCMGIGSFQFNREWNSSTTGAPDVGLPFSLFPVMAPIGACLLVYSFWKMFRAINGTPKACELIVLELRSSQQGATPDTALVQYLDSSRASLEIIGAARGSILQREFGWGYVTAERFLVAFLPAGSAVAD